MVELIVHNYVNAELLDKYIRLAGEIVKATNEKDTGCIKYELCRDTNNPLHFMMLEKWESREALEAHGLSEHYKSIIPEMDSCCNKPVEVTFLETVY